MGKMGDSAFFGMLMKCVSMVTVSAASEVLIMMVSVAQKVSLVTVWLSVASEASITIASEASITSVSSQESVSNDGVCSTRVSSQ